MQHGKALIADANTMVMKSGSCGQERLIMMGQKIDTGDVGCEETEAESELK